MEKLIKSFLKSSIVSAIVLIVLGLLLIFESEPTIYTISYVIGGLLIAIGAIAIIKFLTNIKVTENNYDINIIYGIVCILMGVIVIEHPKEIASMIPIVLGIVIIASSATKLQYTLQMKDKGSDAWKTTVIVSIISLLCGVVILFNPFKAAEAMLKIIGVFILIYGILDVISTLSIKKTLKNVINIEKEIVSDAKIVDEEEKPKAKKKTTAKKNTTKKKTTNKNAK